DLLGRRHLAIAVNDESFKGRMRVVQSFDAPPAKLSMDVRLSTTRGDGLWVIRTEDEARLFCAFQNSKATQEGLWLTPTAPGAVKDRFRVTGVSIGRASDETSLARTCVVAVSGKTARFARPVLSREA